MSSSNKGRRKHGGRKNRPPTERAMVARDEIPKQLPALLDQLCVGMTLRFLTTGNWLGSLTVTYYNLLDAWFMSATATTAYQLFDFVRIKKVTVRGVGYGSLPGGAVTYGPAANVGIELPGIISGLIGGGKQRIGTSLGYDEPAYVSLKPDPMSQAAQFQAATQNPAFIVRARDELFTPLVGAVIDVQVVYRNSADVSPAALQNARAAMNPGQLYFGGLDGLAVANTVAKSAFLPTI